MWVSQEQHNILRDIINEVDRFAIKTSNLAHDRIRLSEAKIIELEDRVKRLENICKRGSLND